MCKTLLIMILHIMFHVVRDETKETLWTGLEDLRWYKSNWRFRNRSINVY